MKRKLILLSLFVCCFCVTGCTYQYETFKKITSQAESAASREYTNSNPTTLEKGETLKTDQFELTIHSATLTDYWSGYYVEDPSWRYLIVEVTIHNIYQNQAMLDLCTEHFNITWSDLGDTSISHEDIYSDNQLADYNNFIKVFKNTSRTGNLIYVVPEGISDYHLLFDSFRLAFSAEETNSWYDDYYHYGYEDQDMTLIESYEIMETDDFLLTINSISHIEDYENTGSNGQYVAVNVTIQNLNTEHVSLELYDYDFTLSWQGFYLNGQYPLDYDMSSPYTEQQLPEQYSIFSGDSKTGDLIFLVPKNTAGLALEYYDYVNQYRTYLTHEEIPEI